MRRGKRFYSLNNAYLSLECTFSRGWAGTPKLLVERLGIRLLAVMPNPLPKSFAVFVRRLYKLTAKYQNEAPHAEAHVLAEALFNSTTAFDFTTSGCHPTLGTNALSYPPGLLTHGFIGQ